MKEMRPAIATESGLKESAAINKKLGEQVHTVIAYVVIYGVI